MIKLSILMTITWILSFVQLLLVTSTNTCVHLRYCCVISVFLLISKLCFLCFYHLFFSSYVLQAKKRPTTDFMEKVQKDINASMRAILVDWLVEVSFVSSKTRKNFVVIKIICLYNSEFQILIAGGWRIQASTRYIILDSKLHRSLSFGESNE